MTVVTIEATIFSALTALVDARCYPDVAPEKVERPYIVYQQVGGAAINFLDGSVPSKRRSRFQVAIWGDTRAEVAELAAQVSNALRGVAALQTTVEGEPLAQYEPDTKLRGSLQDFSFIF